LFSIRRAPLIILVALVTATVAAYWQVGRLGFVTYDDPSYVSFNLMVNQGLRSASVLWAFTATHGANWHPLTSLSHMLDCSITGTQQVSALSQIQAEAVFREAAHFMHWENLFFHTLNTVLVFLVWRRVTAGPKGTHTLWQSAVVAGLFALHPLHVESVAWISERKDVLSTALWLLTILAYARWVEQPTSRRYALVALGTVLGLMTKPMLATLPCTLLLLDYWPLRRWPARSWFALVREKIPLFALVALLCIVTLLVQRALGATDYGEKFPFAMRLGNAFVSYARYLGKTFWPDVLSPFYPHPGWWPWAVVLGAFALFATVSWAAWRERERRPWLLFGWCWYLGTLVPVIGVAQVGAQSMADRYTYVSLLGIFTIVAWGGAELAERWPRLRWALGTLAVAVLAACGIRTALQVPVWKDPVTLIEHMRASIGEHEIVYRELGMAYLLTGRSDSEVLSAYQRGHAVKPDYAYFLNEIGTHDTREKRFQDAHAKLQRVVDLLPLDPAAHANFANFFIAIGQYDEADRHLRKALELRPGLGGVHRLMAEAHLRRGRKTDARDSLRTAVRCDRWDFGSWNQLGIIESELGNLAVAEKAIARAHWINPRERNIAHNLRVVREKIAKGTK
jgi:Flp pilus assembly protein TadD